MGGSRHHHRSRKEDSPGREPKGILSWVCCACPEGIQSVALHEQCSNGQCQHTRCPSCTVDGVQGYFSNQDSNNANLQSRSTSIKGPPSTSASIVQTSTIRDESLNRKGLDPASERLSFSVGQPPNAPGLLELPLQLSDARKERLAYLDQLKVFSKATFNEAAHKHAQQSSASSLNSDKSSLERYLHDLTQPTEFVFAWEWSILPFLVEVLPEWLGRGYSINVMRHPADESAQMICFTSKIKPSLIRRIIIARHVLDVIPDKFYKSTFFRFYHGEVDFLHRGTSEGHPDTVCHAKNPYFYLEPMMGDSIGPSNEETAATLGPCLKFGDEYLWLANLHVFLKQLKKREEKAQQTFVLHPGLLDKNVCRHTNLKTNLKKYVKFGTLYATSGKDLTTTRQSSHPYWQMFQKPPSEVVTDWVLISYDGHTVEPEILADDETMTDVNDATDERDTKGKQKHVFKPDLLLNTLRMPGPGKLHQCVRVTNSSHVRPGAKIRTTGRTSGHQYGQICLTPAYLDKDKGRQTTKPTREWFIERSMEPAESEEDWLKSGIGVPGDSGAPVVGADDNTLYGQIWGRNRYWGPGPRIAYFTTIPDISEDIKDKCPLLEKPLELPQGSSGERCAVSELYCPRCAKSKDETTASNVNDGGSEGMSVASVPSSDGPDEHVNNTGLPERELTDEAPCDLMDLTLSDVEDVMSVDSGNAEASSSPSQYEHEDFEEFDDLPHAGLDENVALEMALDPFQYYDSEEYDFGINDGTLSLDEIDDAGNDVGFIGRSCARKEISQVGVPSERSSDSWVMVCSKPKEARKMSSRVTAQPQKNSHSLLGALVKTTELMTGLVLT